MDAKFHKIRLLQQFKKKPCILKCFILFRVFLNFFFVWTKASLGSYLNLVNFYSFFTSIVLHHFFSHFSQVFTCFVFSLTYAFVLFLL